MPELLRSVLACPSAVESMVIVHPSWWPVRRVKLLTTAARGLTEDIVTVARSRPLFDTFAAAAVVEIAAALVAVTAAGITAEPRLGPPDEVAAAVARRVLAACPDPGAAVVIDAPAGVGGTAALATMIADRLPNSMQVIVVHELPADDVAEPAAPPRPCPAPAHRVGRRRLPAAVAAALCVVAWGMHAHHDRSPARVRPRRIWWRAG